MRIIAEYKGEEIVLKKYTSYLELDKDLLSFEDKKDLMGKLGLDKRTDDIYILDNNGHFVIYDPEIVRTTLSFYENKKGDEFVRWIFYSACNTHDKGLNKNKLSKYFMNRSFDFNKGKGKDEFDINDINNNEGRRLYSLIMDIITGLGLYSPAALNSLGTKDVLPKIESYVKKDNKYDYAYMRKFACVLRRDFDFRFRKSGIDLIKVNEKDQERVLTEFKTSIHNNTYPKKQVTFNDLVDDETVPTYDENGIKIDEKEFLDEFKMKYTL